MITNNKFLVINKQYIINYYYKPPEDNLPVIVFLPGYLSNIKGKKSLFLKDLCLKYGYGYLTFDYRGHGESSGNVSDYSLKDWLNDVVFTIDNFIKIQKKILIGSSMGGWLSFLYALKYPELVSAIVGIAPALDFTEDLKNSKNSLILHPHNKELFYLKDSMITNTIISKKLLNVPDEYLILKSTPINLNMPIRLLHGMLDNIVLYNKSLKISENVLTNDVIVSLVKNGDHSLSTVDNLKLLESTIRNLVNK